MDISSGIYSSFSDKVLVESLVKKKNIYNDIHSVNTNNTSQQKSKFKLCISLSETADRIIDGKVFGISCSYSNWHDKVNHIKVCQNNYKICHSPVLKSGQSVLIDLMGATGDGQASVVLLRPAPLQVTWLGFPGTSGMDEIDYILADRHVAPPGSEGEFSECIVRLPDTFQPNDSQRAISSAVPTRASQGLPENGFVFCCHNNTYKVLPGMFDIWMRLLHRVPGSVLWLVNDGEHVRTNLRAQAARRGIDGGRLVFAERSAYGDYLARYRLADLFLDTLPFNAGTTASDALWAGLPVLTQTGRSFAGRMAASLLHAVGLPELVTQTADEYEALALRLATHAQELAALRQRLNQQGRASALFDTARLTRHLEQALLTMCQRQQQGLPPQGFDVPALPAA